MNQYTKGLKKFPLAAVAGAVALAALTVTQSVSAEGKSCDNGTLRGDYGIQMQGSTPTPPFPPTNGAIQSVIGVVMRSFDGHGNFEQTDNIRGSLTEFVPDRPGFGTYEVYPDCTGATRHQPDANNPNLVIEERLVILDNGNEIRSITVAPPLFMVTTVGKRVRKN
jgi:hypothetical protein